MDEFALGFARGQVTGDGIDIIGRFTVTGRYAANGDVRLVKQYVGKHAVVYEGRHDGEGTILGVWSISPFWSGPFALRPVAPKADPAAPIQRIE
jgi:hypothetical protein